MNSAQKNYTVREKELLGIVEGLKGFENVPRGMEIIIYTARLNLLYAKNASQRMVRGRLILEEFSPKEIRHIAGEDNVIADCLSRMEMEPREFGPVETEASKPMLEYCNMLHNMEELNILKERLKETIEEAPFPQAPKLINQAKQECEVLKKLIAEDEK